MRNFILWMLLLIVLAGCAGQKMYYSKGVYYPQKPAKELDFYTKLQLPVLEGSSGNLHLAGRLIKHDNLLYFPILTRYSIDGKIKSYTSIYTINPSSGAVLDSLIIQENGRSCQFVNLVSGQGVLIVGTRDSLLSVIVAKDNLKDVKDIPLDIKNGFLADAKIVKDRLRLALIDANNDLVMYDLMLDDFSVERKRLLAKSLKPVNLMRDNDYIWSVDVKENTIKTVKLDLSATDPEPEYKDIAHDLSMTGDYDLFTVRIADSMLYLRQNKMIKEGKLANTVESQKAIALDMNTGEVSNSKEIILSDFDVTHDRNDLFYFEHKFINPLYLHRVFKTSADLQDVQPLVSFAASKKKLDGTVFFGYDTRMIKIGNKLYLCGYWYKNIDKSKKGTEEESLYFISDKHQNLFLTAYSLD